MTDAKRAVCCGATCKRQADDCVAATYGAGILRRAAEAGFVLVPAEMTEAQAIRSMAGHALADRVRDVNPAEFARWVQMRRATWRQLVAAMSGHDKVTGK